ncbi:Retrovirus-related Pol polyprotein from transposon TNT 1-94 [Apostasia shenzhenica]|uniref:Retrovirus-related Pol polyprotein from transposon TNT 1-94 n=1 Tax=Apostasia shenzhenica TaxID=1088818 RepID=A0A2H9ZYF2_9ASPA|nr:Retrovirus-related Pol polyprotein from transposon TNT 1-94 [Apostasia shenzhenica]
MIAEAINAKEAWTILETEYQGTNKVITVNLQNLRRDFENLVMNDSESVQEFSSRVNAVVKKIRTLGEILPEQKVVEKVLRSLPPKFNFVVAAIEESKDLRTYSLNELMGSMRSHEQNIWFLDSGCSNHMTGVKEIFKSLDESIKLQVCLGDSKQIKAEGKGIVSFKGKSGTEKLIHDVLYIPGLKHNLISVGQLVHKGYSIVFHDNKCIIKNMTSNALIMEIPMTKNRMFPIRISVLEHVLVANIQVDSWLWHKRYGHLNFHGLKLLYEKKMVDGLPSIDVMNEVCEGCIYGKHQRSSFPVGKSWRARKPLQLIHADICGPMQTPSLNNSKYFLLFVDDLSRKSWLYFIKQKSEAFSKFLIFKASAEKECGEPIQILRTDRGSEFCSNEFTKFCQLNGIKRQLTASYTPQQNGVAERKNRTIVEMARSMLKAKNLPISFWAEAVATTVHLLNISPTKAVWNSTPYEAWYGVKPNVSNLRVFGCIVYAHVNTEVRQKFDSKSTKCIFIGYSQETKGYRVYNPITKQLYVSRDVIFDENACWDWKPTCFEEAIHREEWKQSMEEEISAINKNKTWALTDLPEGKAAIGLKWVFRVKYNVDGSVHKYKARLVVKGYAQQAGIDYFETFSPVARMETIRTVLSLAAHYNWNVYQFDVKSAFLNGDLFEDVYVEQPQGFIIQGKQDKVYKLKKALYGLKQAPRAWYEKIDSYFCSNGFQRSESEPTLYVKKGGMSHILIVCLYVDDIIYTSSSSTFLNGFKEKMKHEFEMTDLGLLHYFLGLEIKQTSKGIFLSQEKYTSDLLEKFGMRNCNKVETPMNSSEKLQLEDGTSLANSKYFRSLVGGLMYLTHTRPDLLFAVSMVSRFMHKPTKQHLGAAKRILRYIKGTSNYGIWYSQTTNIKLFGFCDSDWAGSLDDRKSTSGFLFTLGSGAISWTSKKQASVALSSSEAEYVAAASACCQAIWIRRILTDLHQPQEEATNIFCDNMGAILMAKNPCQHGRAKHIDIKYHFIREMVSKGAIEMKSCSTHDQVADILTKALPSQKFINFRKCLGVCDFASREDVKSDAKY